MLPQQPACITWQLFCLVTIYLVCFKQPSTCHAEKPGTVTTPLKPPCMVRADVPTSGKCDGILWQYYWYQTNAHANNGHMMPCCHSAMMPWYHDHVWECIFPFCRLASFPMIWLSQEGKKREEREVISAFCKSTRKLHGQIGTARPHKEAKSFQQCCCDHEQIRHNGSYVAASPWCHNDTRCRFTGAWKCHSHDGHQLCRMSSIQSNCHGNGRHNHSKYGLIAPRIAQRGSG